MKIFIFLWLFLQCFQLIYSNPVRSKRNSSNVSIKSNDDRFYCFKHENDNWRSFTEETRPTQLISIPGKNHLCCVAFAISDLTNPKYYVRHSQGKESSFVNDDPKYSNIDSCFKGNEGALHCCCTKDKCNHANFALYNYNKIQYSPSAFKGIEIVFFIFSLLFIPLILVIIYIISRYTCLNKYSDKNQVELSAMKNIDLRGIIVQPYHSPQEVDAIISQITNSKSLNPREPSDFKKVKFRSVTTFSTVDDLTIREPAPIELPPLTSNDPCMEMITHMVKYGPKEIKFDPNSLILCYDRALTVLKNEPILQEASLPVAIYGDLHGQYSDLIRFFHLNGWPPTTRCCFMGDYVDRGRHSLEVITLLLCLKAVMPHDVYLNRGNHEDANLPLATRLNNKILCMHGGLSPKIESWDSISEIKRPIFNLVPNTLACDLCWSDPDKQSDDYMVNFKRDKKNGIGFMFGHKQVYEMCKILDIQLIVRGHQAPMNGYELFTSKMCTLFSAPGYRGIEEEANFGASMFIDEKGNIDITRIGVSNNVRRERNRQKLNKGDGYLDWKEIKDRPLEDDDERSC
uniref:Serine/threonine-protein phosphatase n=1 Tax=Panagrolaimus sp. PS1159 TaxID=55785 RepID=A0AC35EWP8_9BILA